MNTLTVTPAPNPAQPGGLPRAWLGCALALLVLPAQATEVQRVGDRIVYRGDITQEANLEAQLLYAAAEGKPTTLWIESQGGSARAGIELGTWVFEQQLNVQVMTYCFSSCANYVFTAGARKLLAPRASLVWHGGPTQQISAGALAALLEQTLQRLGDAERERLLTTYTQAQLLAYAEHSLDELVNLETQFYAMIQVDPRITTLGQSHVPELGGPYKGWDYSLRDLAVLGVRHIELPAGECWQPLFPLLDAQIFRIDLAALPDFAPLPSLAPAVGE